PDAGDARPTLAGSIEAAFVRLRVTLGELRRFRHAFLMLLAFLVYNDRIGTVIRMAPLYASQSGIASGDLILALLIVQFVGIPFAFLFGMLADRIGAKRASLLSLIVHVDMTTHDI